MSNVKYAPEEPIAAIATALAPAALGIVRCSGKNCIELVSAVFSRPNALRAASGNTLVYGWIISGGAKIDEVMVSVYRAPKSFTGEDMIEISCHGGPGYGNPFASFKQRFPSGRTRRIYIPGVYKRKSRFNKGRGSPGNHRQPHRRIAKPRCRSSCRKSF